jgi:tetratricopeptide (TPR) repeat protein
MARSGNRKGAIPLYQRALALVEPLAGEDRAGAPLELQLEISRQLGSAEFHSGDFPKAVEHYQRAHAIGSRLMAASPANPMAQRAVAEALAGMAQVYTRQGKIEQALGQLSESVTIRERLLRESPSQPLAKREAAAASLAWGDALSAAGRRSEAISPYRRALTLAEELVRIDGRNRLYQRDLALSLERLSETLLQAGSRTEAHDATRRALEAWWPLVDTRDPLVNDLQRYVWLLVTTPFDDLRSPARALPYAQKLVETTKSADPATLDALARAYFGVGDAAKAAETERKALALLPPMQPGETPPACVWNWKRISASSAAPGSSYPTTSISHPQPGRSGGRM